MARITAYQAAATPAGDEFLVVAQVSSSATITASTISAAASDNSLNDSGNGFLTAGFAAGQSIRVRGFTGNAGNNVDHAVIQTATAGKLVLTGATLVDDAAGESVTVKKWDTRRLAISDAVGLAGKHAVPIMAASMQPRQSNGCAPLGYLSGASNQPDLPYLAFDSATQEYAEFAIIMPSSWNEGAVTFAPVWSHGSTATNFGVAWGLRAVAIGNDDPFAATFGTAQTSIDTGGTTDDIYSGPESAAITVAGTPQAGDLVCFQLYREPANGGDTLAVDARLHGIVLYITAGGFDA